MKLLGRHKEWESTKFKDSHLLKGHADFMRELREKNPNKLNKPYDNRHEKMRVA